MRIFPDIHQVDGITCNVFVIVEPDGLTVIDAGMPGAAPRILAAIAALGRQPREVRRVLLSHQHVDHIGGLAALVAATGAETWAHPRDTPAIEGRGPREAPHGLLGLVFRAALFPRLRPVTITHAAVAGDVIPALSGEGGLQVIDTPGHTMGHISFYSPGRKLLFAGDAVRESGGRIKPPPAMLSFDMPLALQSARTLAAMEVEACLPGHGAAIAAGAGARFAIPVEADAARAGVR
ncbi:MAG: MBL fold metallo-hydrolase [Chloroflexota bacterium]|nr:MBL fold metallo-hydrolase [Chloroflexota bacterium]